MNDDLERLELPPYPEPEIVDGEPVWFDRHMQEYARAAILADRQRRDAANTSAGCVKESAESEHGDEVLELPPEGHPLHRLGQRLTELLDEHQWAECEYLLLQGWDHDRIDRKTGQHWRENSSLEVWFPFTAEELEKLRRERAQAAEPVAWLKRGGKFYVDTAYMSKANAEKSAGNDPGAEVVPLYAAPVEVTEAMIERALDAKGTYWRDASPEAKRIMKREMRAALEAALGGGHETT